LPPVLPFRIVSFSADATVGLVVLARLIIDILATFRLTLLGGAK